MNYFCRPLKNFKTQEKKFNLLGFDDNTNINY